MMIALQLLGGVLLLYVGAETLVRGSAALALRMGITPLVVGLTVISFGTSAPELVVSLNAAMGHDSAIALGNVMGSNIANLALVLGLAALIRPLRVEHQVVRQEMPIMLAATVLMGAMLWNGRMSRWEGGVLVLALIVYTVTRVRRSHRHDSPPVSRAEQSAVPVPQRTLMHVVLLVIGLILLVPGAHLFVLGAVQVATRLGLSPLVIGLTVVAVGTSLPEVATSVVASARGEGDLAVGNAVGSNIFNIVCILGLTALLFGIDGGGVNWIDVGVMLATAIVCLPVMRSGFVISRLEGLLLLAGYIGYMAYVVLR